MHFHALHSTTFSPGNPTLEGHGGRQQGPITFTIRLWGNAVCVEDWKNIQLGPNVGSIRSNGDVVSDFWTPVYAKWDEQ